MRVTTYKGPSTSFRTKVIVSNSEPCGSKNYLEAHIWREKGILMYNITDGYRFLDIDKPIRDNLKSAINIVEGYLIVK